VSDSERTERHGPEYSAGGFREQPLVLKLLLLLSVVAITVGVVRCSFELSASPPPVATVGVAVAPSTAVPDSVARAMATRFASALEDAEDVGAAVVEPGARGFDAMAVMRAKLEEGMLSVSVELSDTRARRYLGTAEAVGPTDMSGDIAALAAERAAPLLGLGGESPDAGTSD
jgi:hypothetical protein